MRVRLLLACFIIAGSLAVGSTVAAQDPEPDDETGPTTTDDDDGDDDAEPAPGSGKMSSGEEEDDEEEDDEEEEEEEEAEVKPKPEPKPLPVGSPAIPGGVPVRNPDPTNVPKRTGTANPNAAQLETESEEKRVSLAVGDPEFGEGPSGDPDSKNPLKLEFNMRSEVHTFENLDLRALDESSDQAIIDSDDRHTFAYSGISARVGYQVLRDLEVGVAVAHNGLWAEDQIGERAAASGSLNFSELAFMYKPIRTNDFHLGVSVGRQPFAIGGVPNDYVLDDILDAAVLTADANKLGRLRVLVIDFYAANDLPDAAFVRYISGRETVLGLRGDTFTLRSGVVYENENAVEGLSAKAYYFYADIGGGPIDESGADVTYGGALGNFSDNDWAAVAGGRVAYDLDAGSFGLLLYGEGAQSFGLDRKEVVARDVEIDGMMFGGGTEASYEMAGFGVKLRGSFYSFDGPAYSSDGLQQNHGFVGFKGRGVGGLNLDRYAGFHPSAYVGAGGVINTPHEVERISGTQFIHAGLEVSGFDELVTVAVDVWTLTDSGESFLNFAELETIDPPFGYSREEYAAQRRHGEDLGQEIDLQLVLKPNSALEFYAVYAMFAPGSFYEIEVNRVAGTALGSNDPQTFWAATGGAVVSF